MQHSNDDGVILALLERYKKQRLPRTLRLKEKVDSGGTLNDADIVFLDEVLNDARQNMHIVDKHPELEGLVAQAMQLYREIVGAFAAKKARAGNYRVAGPGSKSFNLNRRTGGANSSSINVLSNELRLWAICSPVRAANRKPRMRR